MTSNTWITRFGLRQNPFKDTLDTSLFFRTRQHEEALIRLRIGLEDGHAIILLTGPSGTGKTIATQVVLRAMDRSRFAPVFVFAYPGMTRGTMLGAILKELGVEEIPPFAAQRLTMLQEKAMTLHAGGWRLVIFLDEAHFLKADVLHVLRTLSNFETEQEKLVTVLLVAEDSLLRRLKAPPYASLLSRITFAVTLEALSRAETEQYIKYRLLKSGAQPNLLTPDAYVAAHDHSRGVPREVNRLLYNGFLEAMGQDTTVITSDVLTRAEQRMAVLRG